MGAPLASVFLREPDDLGPGLAAGHPLVDGLPVDGLAYLQESGEASAPAVVGLDGAVLRLAVAAVQPDHALPAAHLSAAGDDGGLVRVREPESQIQRADPQLASIDPGPGRRRPGVDRRLGVCLPQHLHPRRDAHRRLEVDLPERARAHQRAHPHGRWRHLLPADVVLRRADHARGPVFDRAGPQPLG